MATEPQIKSADDMPADTRRGGDVRTLLSPKTVGSTSGFMGVATVPPGEYIAEHYHPYSEEFIYVVQGEVTCEVGENSHKVKAREAIFLPIETRHRLRNEGSKEAFIVFHLGPLAPRPDMGHVDTEERATVKG